MLFVVEQIFDGEHRADAAMNMLSRHELHSRETRHPELVQVVLEPRRIATNADRDYRSFTAIFELAAACPGAWGPAGHADLLQSASWRTRSGR